MELPIGFEIHDNVFEDSDKIINWLETMQWQKSPVVGDIENMRTSKTHFVPFLNFSNPLFIHSMNKAIWEKMDRYAQKWGFGFSSVENVSFQKYEIGQKYDLHVDSGAEIPRILSVVAYLNDVEEGGETYFSEFDFKVKPKTGRIVIFPSNFIYRHAALPPTKGVKYAAAYWAKE